MNTEKSCITCKHYLKGYTPCFTCIDYSAWDEYVEDTVYITNQTAVGKKFDTDKIDWTLMPWKELEQVLEILEFGAKKYSRDNWQNIEPIRYEKAAMRHLISYVTGEKKDSETNKSHLAHLICNALFLMWNDNKNG